MDGSAKIVAPARSSFAPPNLIRFALNQIDNESVSLTEFSSEQPHELSQREKARLVVKFMQQQGRPV